MSKWAVRHPVWALIAWLAVVVGIGIAATTLGGKFNDSFALPGAQSTTAQQLLTTLGKGNPVTTSVTVAWEPMSGKATDKATLDQIYPVLKDLAQQPNVTCVVGPAQEDFGPQCPTTSKKDLEQIIADKATEEIAKATKLSTADVEAAGQLIPKLRPIADLNATDLGKVAASLPAVAKLAQAPRPVLDDLAAIRSKDWSAIPGFTLKDADAITAALGGLDRAAQLPAGTLEEFAQADPRKLQAAAEKIPAKIAQLEKDWAAYQRDLAELERAARATKEATSTVSNDGRIATATVTVSEATLSQREANAFYDIIKGADSDALTVGAQGSALEGAGTPDTNSDALGLLAAIIILLIAFGSLIAAGLPIVVAIMGLIGGQMLVVVAAHFLDVPSFAPTLAAMIGLGVGIDYALFVLNRYRQGLQEEMNPKDAATKAVGTAGRAVLFAGSTVIIALLGMFVLGITFFNGLAVAAASAVLLVMASALIFLPALLSLLGTKALSLRLPWARTLKSFNPDTSRWSSYARLLQKAPVIPALLSLIIVLALASPALALRMGFPDDGTQGQGTPLRTGFELMAKGFGEGVNGPFFVAVKTDRKDDFAALAGAIKALETTPGVARTLPTSAMMPLVRLDKKTFGDGGDVTSIIVYPTTSPQASATASLLDTIRTTTAPKISSEHGATIYVGGAQAVSTDFTSVLGRALPIFLILVVGLGFIALMLLFQSLVIPLTAALTSLLSFAGALGVTVAAFQLGFMDSLLGITGTGPILPFLPVMVFAILFGLSMDYQVFLVSRMKEAWHETDDNREAVRLGLAGSGRVVVVAASIMTCVFLAFVPTPNNTIKLFGVALASAVIIDAFIVRLVLIPSVMTLLGRSNWWMPRWLRRITPTITLE